MVFVRLRPGISAAAGRENMQRLARSADKFFAADPTGQGNNVAVLGVQRPAQIVNYRNVGSTPVILAVGLAAGCGRRSRPHSCGVGPPTSSRPRPAEDPRLHPPTARGSDHLAGHGGRGGWRHHRDPVGNCHRPRMWVLFARNINAVPDPTIPSLSVLVVSVGTLVLASLVSIVSGRRAARTPTALVLRAE